MIGAPLRKCSAPIHLIIISEEFIIIYSLVFINGITRYFTIWNSLWRSRKSRGQYFNGPEIYGTIKWSGFRDRILYTCPKQGRFSSGPFVVFDTKWKTSGNTAAQLVCEFSQPEIKPCSLSASVSISKPTWTPISYGFFMFPRHEFILKYTTFNQTTR